jgi:hypothetical protein
VPRGVRPEDLSVVRTAVYDSEDVPVDLALDRYRELRQRVEDKGEGDCVGEVDTLVQHLPKKSRRKKVIQ